jgi:acyl carrier protein
MTAPNIKSAIFEELKKVAPESEPATLATDANVRAALDIDSFDFLNFLIALHERLGVEIPEADYGKLGTIDAMLAYLSAKL